MLENLIVAVIVAAAAWYAASKYLPATLRARLFGKKKASAGCGSGCSSCGSCEDAPATPRIDASGPPSQRVIQLHLK
ncbi:hypothetical protein [Massilia pseudoviolaceinigra]|uniref:hypothetical protein n=1 Tax=Massilia pseudoviolaceinigra TaxID=3057165 RepID=UPI002796D5EA|nr:hypothetical protein [Massilia sp. CCM 9206]MDQ1922699.1 hypothetical protein [Massilia sp. CCM 9206]